MKDKEKQIEEMAKIIDDRLIEARGYLGSMNKGEGYWIAQKLIEHYQPKLPKESVVLSKEDYNRLFIKARQSEFQTIDLASIMEAEKKGGKETAEKFYKKVKKLLKKVDIIVDGDEGLVGYEESAVDKGLTELAKQFGVEIKEN